MPRGPDLNDASLAVLTALATGANDTACDILLRGEVLCWCCKKDAAIAWIADRVVVNTYGHAVVVSSSAPMWAREGAAVTGLLCADCVVRYRQSPVWTAPGWAMPRWATKAAYPWDLQRAFDLTRWRDLSSSSVAFFASAELATKHWPLKHWTVR